MTIRFATKEDLAFLTTYDGHVAEPELEHLIRLNRVYLAEESGQLIGWLRYNLFWDSIPFLNMLYLLDGHRGRGFGRQLVEYWETQMRLLNYKLVMTSTPSDEYSQHFYHKLGYSTIGGFLPQDDSYETILSKNL